jgi:hypothetical protein
MRWNGAFATMLLFAMTFAACVAAAWSSFRRRQLRQAVLWSLGGVVAAGAAGVSFLLGCVEASGGVGSH